MPELPAWLRRPIPVASITIDPVSDVAHIRDTGISVCDVVHALVVKGVPRSEIPSDFPGLSPGDLNAIDEYQAAPTELDAAIDRALSHDPPDEDDVLTGYLFLPRVRLSYHEDPKVGTPMMVRSSFEAVYTDAKTCPGLWLRAIGYLGLLDQIGTALTRTDRESASERDFDKALELFSDVDKSQRLPLWYLRCALVHDFSLVHRPISKESGKPIPERCHMFVLDDNAHDPLVTFPATPWDGDLSKPQETHVNLRHLARQVHSIRDEIFDCFAKRTLKLGVNAAEARRRYIFTHAAEDSELQAQHNEDMRVRWCRIADNDTG